MSKDLSKPSSVELSTDVAKAIAFHLPPLPLACEDYDFETLHILAVGLMNKMNQLLSSGSLRGVNEIALLPDEQVRLAALNFSELAYQFLYVHFRAQLDADSTAVHLDFAYYQGFDILYKFAINYLEVGRDEFFAIMRQVFDTMSEELGVKNAENDFYGAASLLLSDQNEVLEWLETQGIDDKRIALILFTFFKDRSDRIVDAGGEYVAEGEFLKNAGRSLIVKALMNWLLDQKGWDVDRIRGCYAEEEDEDGVGLYIFDQDFQFLTPERELLEVLGLRENDGPQAVIAAVFEELSKHFL